MKRVVLLFAIFVTLGCVAPAEPEYPPLVPASPLLVGRGAGEVVLVDINHDGHLDIATQHLLQRRITMHFGDGNGSFASPPGSSMALDYEPGAIALGDVNADGVLDLAVARKDSSQEYVHIFMGEGAGRFKAATGSPYITARSMSGYKPTLCIVDINEDGHYDVISANGRRNSIELLLGNGTGAFLSAPPVTLESGQNYYSYALGKVDGDRHLDLVTASTGARGSTNRIAVRWGDGSARFGHAATTLPSVPTEPRVMLLADVDKDHDIDIVLSHVDEGYLSILQNEGQRAFVSKLNSPYRIDAEAFSVAVSDANQDGRIDIFAATVNSVSLLLGDSQAFTPAPGSPFSAGPGAYDLAIGDINEDGKADVVASSFEGSSVAVLLGR